MITDRKRCEENTGVQDSSPYGEEHDIQSDFVMVYGLDNDLPGRIRQYEEKGYITHLMTGVSWGVYIDYLEGKFDGRNHWDEAQMNRDGEYVLHGPKVPYMIPSTSFANYLIENIKPAIDAGVNTIHMEEPEIWVFSGYSEAIKREYRLYYREEWVPPHESVDAYYKIGKLKNYLYTRTLDYIATALREYAMTKYGRLLRFIVPTHSLINYTQFGIVSPESSLMDTTPVDGYIAQIWTGTSRVKNVYHGVKDERVFECAFLEYGVMQELVRGTNRKMWLLQDPIEDNPNYTWEYYQGAYLQGLTAALLQPEVHQYEICPWPRRVWMGKYPRNAGGVRLPKSYETIMLSTTQALRDMDQPYEWIASDADSPEHGQNFANRACETGVGVLIADSSMYQRNHKRGVALTTSPYPETGEEDNFSPFYGLTLPLLKRGIHVLPVQLDNVRRFPAYLNRYKLLILSYEFMKPEQPDLHLALSLWVQNGGTLAIVGDGSDDFHAVSHWWNQNGYKTPTEHLLETLGLPRDAGDNIYSFGKGTVAIMQEHPSAIAYDPDTADEYLQWIRELMAQQRIDCAEKNYFALRRGPYLIAQVMEDGNGEYFRAKGTFVNLYDAKLSILNHIALAPGENLLAADLSRYEGPICLVGSAGRVEDFVADAGGATMRVKGPKGSVCALRFRCAEPKSVLVPGGTHEYDADSGTLFIEFPGATDGVPVEIKL